MWMALGASVALAAGSAHATDVHWSLGIHAPIGPGVVVGTVISNRPGLPVLAPVVVPPVYLPAPVVYAPPVYTPRLVYGPPVYMPRVVYGPPVWGGGRWVRHPGHYPHQHAYRPDHGHYGQYTRHDVRYPGDDHRRSPAVAPVRQPGREIRY